MPAIVLAAYRFVFAALALAAVLTEIRAALARSVSLANFFSFFTIQSNIIVIAVLIAAGVWALRGGASGDLDMARGAATLYIVTVGIVFALLLSGIDMPTAVPWTNTVLHYLMPVVVAADWLTDPPRQRIPLRRALLWLAFPLLWIGYTLVRGALVGWYPYPFLTPAVVGGYGGVAKYCMAIAVGMAIFAAGVSWAGTARRGAVARSVLIAGLLPGRLR
jgi:hypothetical protein